MLMMDKEEAVGEHDETGGQVPQPVIVHVDLQVTEWLGVQAACVLHDHKYMHP